MSINHLSNIQKSVANVSRSVSKLPARVSTPTASDRFVHTAQKRSQNVALAAPRLRTQVAARAAKQAPSENYFSDLSKVASRLHEGREAEAKSMLENMTIPHSDRPAELKARLFKAALDMRATGKNPTEQQGNLYKSNFVEGEEQIDLFNVMGTQMPLVTKTSDVVNQVLMQLMEGHDAVTLLDVGIGTGRQEVALLHALAAAGKSPKDLEIIGIEPGDGLLDRAAAQLLATAKELGMHVTFVAHPGLVEDFDEAQWAQLARPGRHLIINEGFAIHHLSYGARDASDARKSGDAKQDTLRRLQNLKPAAIILSEPDSNHQSDNVSERFANAWHHYGKAFEVIDASDIAPKVAVALKSFFFGRELLDVLGMPDSERTERHETAEMWKSRLEKAGFTATPQLENIAIEDACVTLNKRDAGVYSLEHDGAPVVSVVVRGSARD